MNIVLIGMPGCGKSTIGVIMAKILGMDFIDTDVFIQKNEKRKLQEIIDKEGTLEFLNIEKNNILKINVDNTVIATGGSVILSKEAIEHLRKNAKLVFFDVECDELKKRIYNLNDRGIAMDNNQTLFDVYNYRRPLYLNYADIVITPQNKTLNDTVKETVRQITKN